MTALASMQRKRNRNGNGQRSAEMQADIQMQLSLANRTAGRSWLAARRSLTCGWLVGWLRAAPGRQVIGGGPQRTIIGGTVNGGTWLYLYVCGGSESV